MDTEKFIELCQNPSISENYDEVIEFLDKISKDSKIPSQLLLFASKHNKTSLIKILLKYEITIFNDSLFLACRYENYEIIDLLIKNKAPISRWTVSECIKKDSLKMFKIITQYHQEIEKTEKTIVDNMHILEAVTYNAINLLKLLFNTFQSQNPDKNVFYIYNESEDILLYTACKNNCVEIVNFLLEQKAPTSASVLEVSISISNRNILKAILADGRSPINDITRRSIINSENLINIIKEYPTMFKKYKNSVSS